MKTNKKHDKKHEKKQIRQIIRRLSNNYDIDKHLRKSNQTHHDKTSNSKQTEATQIVIIMTMIIWMIIKKRRDAKYKQCDN